MGAARWLLCHQELAEVILQSRGTVTQHSKVEHATAMWSEREMGLYARHMFGRSAMKMEREFLVIPVGVAPTFILTGLWRFWSVYKEQYRRRKKW